MRPQNVSSVPKSKEEVFAEAFAGNFLGIYSRALARIAEDGSMSAQERLDLIVKTTAAQREKPRDAEDFLALFSTAEQAYFYEAIGSMLTDEEALLRDRQEGLEARRSVLDSEQGE